MKEFDLRYEKCSRELKELYMSLYGNEAMYHKLYLGLRMCYLNRSKALRRRDAEKGGTDWYKSGDMLGMMLYIDNFADDLQGVREKIDYLEKANVNYIHLMPFLDTVPERSDGGYAVADEHCRTATPGLFVAGDCRTKEVRQLTTACADGAVAALAACRFCE